MKIGVVFPSVMYREGPEGVQRVIRGIEEIGFDELAMFDHVVMGHPTDTRRAPLYSPKMPILEAFMVLAHAASITTTIGLGTGVLVLPQREPTLVAKQVATLDTLSGGRVRLGVGTGWQRAEYEALHHDYDSRGTRMDEAIALMRAYWGDEHVRFDGQHYSADDIAMEPKPPQGAGIPIWIGGTRPPALRRVAAVADGWSAMNAPGDPPLEDKLAMLRRYAEEIGRDPDTIGLQMSLSPGPLDKAKRKRFYDDADLLKDRVVELRELGFDWCAMDCVPLFQLGHRSSQALVDRLGSIYDALEPELS
ncbi:MAG: LLM class F420-dependent oxidoreductase [Actinomycetota bacterium]|jgi:probable F420-dependent oxidoreductase|nr:LLM class F420-dependent oxidoreductase [Actinomycetota bacterium]